MVPNPVFSFLNQMGTCGWLRMRAIHRCFILWNLLQSQENAQKLHFWYPLLYWNTSLFTRLACAQEAKGLHKPSPRQVVGWGHFIQETTAGPSHSYPHLLKSSHTVNISSFLPQALSTDISCIWDFLLKNLHMTLFSHYLGHWQNANSSEMPSLTTLYKVAHHSNPNDYCPSLTFPKALIAWNFIVQSFVYIFFACLSQLESEFGALTLSCSKPNSQQLLWCLEYT